MTNNTEQPDIAKIRQLLLAAFTPEELRRFCYDRPDFRPVVRRFGPSQGLDDMVDELITYSDNYRFFPELLAEVGQANPRQYAHILGVESPVVAIGEPQEAQPALPSPEILTISRPISLHLVRVPPGEFQMGSVTARDKDARDDEFPQHPVHVPEFHIGRYPVTNRQYQAFVLATGYHTPYHWKDGKIPGGRYNHPVIFVTWRDAVAFCDWLSQETGQPVRLPTEAEWEKAARGTDGRIYPWGDKPPDAGLCNFENNVKDTTAIGRYSPQGDSPYGCAGMAGNVWDWCQTLYEPYPYQADDGREDLQADGSRVVRGCPFIGTVGFARCAYRNAFKPNYPLPFIGFRVLLPTGPTGP